MALVRAQTRAPASASSPAHSGETGNCARASGQRAGNAICQTGADACGRHKTTAPCAGGHVFSASAGVAEDRIRRSGVRAGDQTRFGREQSFHEHGHGRNVSIRGSILFTDERSRCCGGRGEIGLGTAGANRTGNRAKCSRVSAAAARRYCRGRKGKSGKEQGPKNFPTPLAHAFSSQITDNRGSRVCCSHGAVRRLRLTAHRVAATANYARSM